MRTGVSCFEVLQRHTPAARDALQTAILDNLKANGGVSTLTDKSSPDAIFKAFGVSKKNFKKALGGLYRDKVVVIGDGEVAIGLRVRRPHQNDADGVAASF